MLQTGNLRRLLVVTDAPIGVQQWVDAFIDAARASTPGEWPHPHLNIPAANISLFELWRQIEEHFAPWAVVEKGFPPSPGKAAGVIPNSGSAYHNLLHSLLGDFHRDGA